MKQIYEMPPMLTGSEAHQLRQLRDYLAALVQWMKQEDEALPPVTKGEKGERGERGPAGSDANVTAAAITAALGYTPAATDGSNLEAGVLPIANAVQKTSNRVAAVYKAYTTVCTLNLEGGYWYLITAQLETNKSIIGGYLSAGIQGIGSARYAMGKQDNGGGLSASRVFAVTDDSTVNLISYGYSDAEYTFIGEFAAIRLCRI